MDTHEHRRLAAHRERTANWRLWGPYLSERAWGTVREDYSPNGNAWGYLSHGDARSRSYRWNEDGLAGICDRNQYMCFALALWNERDPILKERMFGLTGPEGNHGEDVKEYYYYLESLPTHAYMKMLYKYPQAAFPYADLVETNGRRGYHDPEYDLIDTGVFDEGRYFDVFVEYGKAGERDLLIEITAHNRGPEDAPLQLLPTLWFRNTWSWGYPAGPMNDVPSKPELRRIEGRDGVASVACEHAAAGDYWWYAEGADEVLFTENESNAEKLWGSQSASPYVKDAFHRHVVCGEEGAVNPAGVGTKAAARYRLTIPAGESRTIRLRLSDVEQANPFESFRDTMLARRDDNREFYGAVQNPGLDPDQSRVQRQALAGMLWSKQLYYYDVNQWLSGDPGSPSHPARAVGRNNSWGHLHNFDVISMPDKWEYPWYATWDSAFHCIPLALVDPDFAKRQLELFTREWYMHPNGQLPAYEWAFQDVNPPVHAWACWRVYRMEGRVTGTYDRAFLESVFHKLLVNFTWWVNRKDADGSNIFQGGFLGLDNIGIFDRSAPLPTGGRIDQSDGTSWMAGYCLQMLKIALELGRENPVYQDLATKFFEHFLRVADAMANLGGGGLWDEEDGFFYDALHLPDGRRLKLKIRSLVGLLPLFAVDTIEPEELAGVPVFRRRMEWFLKNRPELRGHLVCSDGDGVGQRRLISILTKERLLRVLSRLLDEDEFLSPYGIRSLSKYHEEHPFELRVDGKSYSVGYTPGESESGMFGGNSNWRGPIWFPMNYLLVEALQRFYYYYGETLKVECPTGSGKLMNLAQVASEISRRLMSIFLKDEQGERPVYADFQTLQADPHWRDLVLFHEYFHGDTGAGLGAQHQTGWTGLVAKLLQQSGGESPATESYSKQALIERLSKGP
ncbi:MAG: glucosidase [Planctomycetes bacterium]|nr:glucosidase [Planctomycetota bacterium]